MKAEEGNERIVRNNFEMTNLFHVFSIQDSTSQRSHYGGCVTPPPLGHSMERRCDLGHPVFSLRCGKPKLFAVLAVHERSTSFPPALTHNQTNASSCRTRRRYKPSSLPPSGEVIFKAEIIYLRQLPMSLQQQTGVERE